MFQARRDHAGRLVLRHFWAPAHLADLGPLAPDRAGPAPADLADGPLGGLYLDRTLAAALAAAAVDTLLAQVGVVVVGVRGPAASGRPRGAARPRVRLEFSEREGEREREGEGEGEMR